MLRDAKLKFQASPHRQAFEQILLSPAFEEATLAAMLVLIAEQPSPPEVSKGWDTASQLAGAKRYLEILTALHKPAEETKERSAKGLNYEAGV